MQRFQKHGQRGMRGREPRTETLPNWPGGGDTFKEAKRPQLHGEMQINNITGSDPPAWLCPDPPANSITHRCTQAHTGARTPREGHTQVHTGAHAQRCAHRHRPSRAFLLQPLTLQPPVQAALLPPTPATLPSPRSGAPPARSGIPLVSGPHEPRRGAHQHLLASSVLRTGRLFFSKKTQMNKSMRE